MTDLSSYSDFPDYSELGWGKHRQRGQNHNRRNRDQGGQCCYGEAQSRTVRDEAAETEARAIRAGTSEEQGLWDPRGDTRLRTGKVSHRK